MMDISQLSDAELLSRVTAGDAAAEEALAERYSRLVRICARPLFLAGGDSEDLIQEGMFGLLSAIRQYDPASNVRSKHMRRFVSATASTVPSSPLQGRSILRSTAAFP